MKLLIVLALFVATIAAQNLDDLRKQGEIPRYDPTNMRDISPDEKEAIHEAVRLLGMQHHIDPKERTEILKQLMTGEIDFDQAMKRVGPLLETDTKYKTKIDEISERLKRRRSAHIEDLQKHREEMRERRKARMASRNEM
jgi:hypothetical protein